MAHNILENDSIALGSNAPAWHGLGTVVEGLMTSKEALKLANLTWEVTKEPIYLTSGVRIEDEFAIVRNDTKRALGVVGSRYTPIQNIDGFNILDPIIGTDAVYETAGSLRNGRIVWLLAKLKKDYFLRHNDDRMNQYCFIYLSHDGTKPVSVRFTNVRVVCNNTLSAAINGAKPEVTIRHTANYEGKISQAHEILKLADKHAREFSSIMTQLDGVNISNDSAMEKLELIFPGEGKKSENLRDEVFNLFKNGTGNSGKSRADLLNGVTEYITHKRTTRVHSGNVLNEMRFESAMIGSGLGLQEKALQVILD